MADEKKGILKSITDAFTNKDEIAAAEKAAEEKAVIAADAASKAAAAKAAAAKAAADKIAADKAKAAKLAAEKEAQRMAAVKAAQDKVARDLATAAEAAKPKPGTVNVRSLRVRKDHTVDSPVVAGLSFGDKVSIISVWTDGKNSWAELGPGKWAAIKYDGEEMIKLG